MGQEQSYGAPASGQHLRPRHKDRYGDPLQYRDRRQPTIGCCEQNDYQDPSDYKRHRARRSTDSTKSDNSSTESSGYRSGSNSGYDYRSTSERSTTGSDYYHVPLYKNSHYKDPSKELYRPVKIPKDKRCKLKFLDADDESEYLSKSPGVQGYLSEAEKAKLKAGPTPKKKGGIRNYTPKILTDEEQRKKLENWL